MAEMNAEREPQRLYPERPGGADLDRDIEILNNPPDRLLNASEQEKARGVLDVLIKSDNVGSKLGINTPEPVTGLENIYEIKVNTTQLYLEYFLTPEGREAAVKAGIPKDVIDSAKSVDDVRVLFLKHDVSKIDGPTSDKLQKASLDYVTETVAGQFAEKDFASTEGVMNPTRLLIVRNPDKLVQKVEGLRKLKAVLRKYSQTLTGEDNLTAANRLMVEMTRRRLNEMLVELYPEAAAYATQANTRKHTVDFKLLPRLQKAMKGVNALTSGRAQKNFSRLDKYFRGAGVKDGKNYTQLSEQAIRLVNDLERGQDVQAPSDYTFKGVDKAKFSQVEITSEERRQMTEKILKEYGLLSTQTDYDPDRVGVAADKKWQVVDASGNSFAADNKQQVVKNPAASRFLAPARLGTVPVVVHEITHVIQHENKKRQNLSITDRVGMDRSGTNAESGGLEKERDCLYTDFGVIRPVVTDYLKAMAVRLRGGTFRDCFKAFYDSSMQTNPGGDKQKAARDATDRTLRLFRTGGNTDDTSRNLTNSGALEYLEGEVLARKIRGTKLEKLFYLTGVNAEMLAQLHRYGLFSIDSVWIPEKRPIDIIKPEIDAKLAA